MKTEPLFDWKDFNGDAIVSCSEPFRQPSIDNPSVNAKVRRQRYRTQKQRQRDAVKVIVKLENQL